MAGVDPELRGFVLEHRRDARDDAATMRVYPVPPATVSS
jgi:hypothetical protein